MSNEGTKNLPALVDKFENEAESLYEQGCVTEAKKRYLLAIELARHLPGESRTRIASLKINFALRLIEQGNHTEALEQITQATEIDKQCYGEEDTEVADDHHHHAAALVHLAKNALMQAEEKLKRAISIREKCRNLELAKLYNDLGGIYMQMGKFQDARDYFQQALTIAEKLNDSYYWLLFKKNLDASLSGQEPKALMKEDWNIGRIRREIKRNTFFEKRMHLLLYNISTQCDKGDFIKEVFKTLKVRIPQKIHHYKLRRFFVYQNGDFLYVFFGIRHQSVTDSMLTETRSNIHPFKFGDQFDVRNCHPRMFIFEGYPHPSSKEWNVESETAKEFWDAIQPLCLITNLPSQGDDQARKKKFPSKKGAQMGDDNHEGAPVKRRRQSNKDSSLIIDDSSSTENHVNIGTAKKNNDNDEEQSCSRSPELLTDDGDLLFFFDD